MKPLVVFCTAGSLKEARKLAAASVESKLAACAQIIAGVESHYIWKGKKSKSREWLLIFKSSQKCWKRLEKLIRETHSYDTPEIVALKAGEVSAKYQQWWTQSLK